MAYIENSWPTWLNFLVKWLTDTQRDTAREIAFEAGDSRRGMLHWASIKGAFTGPTESERKWNSQKTRNKNQRKRITLAFLTQSFTYTFADHLFHQTWFTLHLIVHHYERGFPSKDRSLIITNLSVQLFFSHSNIYSNLIWSFWDGFR